MDIPHHSNAGAPDWSTLDFEVTCPRCAYNLKLLAQPRCPECGLEFSWPIVVAASREARRDSPLFEYRWRNRPVRSFLYTSLLCLMPARLWKRAELTHTPRAFVIGSWAALLMLFLSGLEWARESAALYILETIIPGITTRYGPLSFTANLKALVGVETGTEFVARVLLLPLIVVFISVYRFTFVRYRIIWLHLLRVGVYVWATYALWTFIANLLLTTLCVANISHRNTLAKAVPQTVVFSVPMPNQATLDGFDAILNWLPPFATAWSLWLGFAAYLQVKRAWAGAACSMGMITVAYFVLCATMAVQIERNVFGEWLVMLDQWLPGLHELAQAGVRLLAPPPPR
ncbi:MAG: hypothetical protein AMXMBFR47_27190 [Planctomycetota bacterium]